MLSFLDSTLGTDPLAGVVVTGAPFPKELARYIERLSLNASAVLEVYSDYPDMIALLEKLKVYPRFKVELGHLETFIRHGQSHVVQQSLYIITRVEP